MIQRIAISVFIIFICGWEGYYVAPETHYSWSFQLIQLWGLYSYWCYFVVMDLHALHKDKPYTNDWEDNIVPQVGLIFIISSLLLFYQLPP